MAIVEHEAHTSGNRQRILVVIGTVIIGYAVALANALSEPAFAYSTLKVGSIVLIGIVYSYLLLNDRNILGERPAPGRLALYFLIMLVLVGLTFSLLRTIDGIWLIAMPLVGLAAALLSQLWFSLFSAAVLTVMMVPSSIRFGFENTFPIAVSLSPAFLFIYIFVRLWLNAEDAREKTQTLADQLEEANYQLASYATQAEELATTKERNRLAREIHDSLGHYLTVINVQIEAARAVMAQNPEQASDALQKAQILTQEGLASVRQSVAALRDSPLRDRPLSAAITDMLEESRNAGLVVEFETKGDARPLEPSAELTLYRAVQEGLTNIRKHARASRVDLTLDYQDADKVWLTIQDNGVGSIEMDTDGFGLLGVGERVKLLAGKMVLDTSPGNGFKLTIMVPA
ncbi:MAG: sensor histidine kinase [Candidatus Promineifilaceae bacterium]